MEQSRSALDASRATIGRTPPGPPTFRSRLSGAVIGAMSRMLWWYRHALVAAFDAVAQNEESQGSLLRILLKRQSDAAQRIEQLSGAIDSFRSEASRELHAIDRHLGALDQQVAGLEQRLTAAIAAHDSQLLASERRISEAVSNLGLHLNRTREDLTLQSRRVTILLEEFRKRHPEQSQPSRTVQAEIEAAMDEQFLAFEDILRGPHVRAAGSQAEYLPYLKEHGLGTAATPILDVGCGNGEWLQLLRENGFTARGVESNARMLESCRSKDLRVERDDAIAYLRRIEEASLGAVTAIHFVEHLPYTSLVAFLDETLRVLRPGGSVIIETPNPENLLVGGYTFYMDPTRIRPLPSGLLRLLLEWRGFSDVEIRNLHPYPAAIRFPETSGLVGARLNQYLYGPQDYALLARKT